jgi:hypothetical protein
VDTDYPAAAPFTGYCSLVAPPEAPEVPKDWVYDAPKDINFATDRRLDPPAVVGPYKLEDDLAARLALLASGGCKFCHGTGISRWRAHGQAANVCKCVRKHLIGALA